MHISINAITTQVYFPADSWIAYEDQLPFSTPNRYTNNSFEKEAARIQYQRRRSIA